MDWKDQLTDLVNLAERTGKLLYCRYEGLWFTPSELREEHANGRFLWSVQNWTLRDPDDFIDAAQRRLTNSQREYKEALRRMATMTRKPS